MAYINDSVFDEALNKIRNEADTLHICSAPPVSYASLNSVGSSTCTINAPANGSPSGRAITIQAISSGSVSSTATAAYWAIVDDGGSALLAWGDLSASQSVTNGNTFTLTAFAITIKDAVDA